MIMPPTRPSITNNPLPNHNFGKGPRINGLMTKERSKEDLSVLIYNLLECFMMTWEELMDRTSTTTTRYDIWKKYQNPRITKHSQMGGDTSNPNQAIQHPQMGGDTSKPNQTIKHPQ